MKQVSQRLRDGRIEVAEVPPPELRPEGVLVAVHASLLSTGTERKRVETGRRSLLAKARSRPDDVRRVIEKARRDGIGEAIDAVRARLDAPTALGYSAAGVVLAAGSSARDLGPGDRVACAGGGYAVHAEIDYVPANLAVRIPDGVDFEAAAFATVGSIALHAVRTAGAQLGDRVAVVGLGLVGQLTAQILRAAGCRVIGIDLDAELAERALRDGAADVAFARAELEGELPPAVRDCDAVVITAATSSSDPVRLAAELSRDRGRVVVVGDVGMEVPRSVYYDKELELRTSRSYGPGRYDREYEERGLDYPVGYVRWTERRNMAAFLDLVADHKVDVTSLVTDRFPVEDAVEAYERLLVKEPSPLAIVLRYRGDVDPRPTSTVTSRAALPASVGVVGAGSFATRILIPALADAGFTLEAVASAGGLSARATADRFRFGRAVTVEELLADPTVSVVAVATRHSSHAVIATAALRAGKAVFLEKPAALTEEELDDLRAARDESGRPLAVGFNRRYAPLARALRDHVRREGVPFELLYRVNAGRLPDDHWLNDSNEGGGRLLGEGCHFIDFACWVAGMPPRRVSYAGVPEAGRPSSAAQSFSVTLTFDDGSLATILYAADGADRVAKEYVEVHSGLRSAILDDFKQLSLHGGGRSRTLRNRGRDKGHRAELAAFRARLDGAPDEEPDPLDSTAATLAAARSAEVGHPVGL
jgi:predicted dehydrogenase